MDWFGRDRRAIERAKAQLDRALTALDACNFEPAIALFDAVLDAHQNSGHPTFHMLNASALYNKGVALSGMGRSDLAMQSWRLAHERFGEHRDADVARWVVMSMFNLAGKLERREALSIYGELVSRCDAHADPRLSELACETLSNVAIELH